MILIFKDQNTPMGLSAVPFFGLFDMVFCCMTREWDVSGKSTIESLKKKAQINNLKLWSQYLVHTV